MSADEGRCLCGAIRYAVLSEPSHLTMCHCRFCQRATGGAYMVEPVFDEAEFSVIKGVAKVYEHSSEGSGKIVYVHFCENCGTKLYLSFERFPGSIGVYGGTFDNPNWHDHDPETSKQIFLAAAQNGTVIPPGVNTFEEHATTNDGTPIEPTVFSEAKIMGQPEK